MDSDPGGYFVTGVDPPPAVATLLDQKARRRLELAKLPIEEKVRLVVLMQRHENEVRRAAGRPEKPEWNSSVEEEKLFEQEIGRPSLPSPRA